MVAVCKGGVNGASPTHPQRIGCVVKPCAIECRRCAASFGERAMTPPTYALWMRGGCVGGTYDDD
eukprot:4170350-Pyramimonas_sp.AAC.1